MLFKRHLSQSSYKSELYGIELTLYQQQNFRKHFADNKIDVGKKLVFVLGRLENIVGKGENAGYQHFLLFPQCFQKASFSRSLKVEIVW